MRTPPWRNHRRSTETPCQPGTGPVIAMQGALNVRAISGLRIADGRLIRPGILYRSSALTYLTDRDCATLHSRKIDTVIDFRGAGEQAAAPDRPLAGVTTINAPVNQDELDLARIDALLDEGRFSPQMHDREKVDGFGPFYRMFSLVNSYGDPGFLPRLAAYTAVFDTLLDPDRNGAVLMHCTGGRDRTGIAAAIVLRALGVHQDAIEADYLASNMLLQPDRENPKSLSFQRFPFSSVYLQPVENRRFREVAAQLGETSQHLHDAVTLRAEYLSSLWATIDRRFGCFEAFLSTQLGMTAERLIELRDRMTQRPLS